RDPTFLFDSAPFKQCGALFWPDRLVPRRPEEIWRSCGLEPPAEPEFESGQIVVDKCRCWRALRLALWFNEHCDFYYHHLYGDKDTFCLAFRKLQVKYQLAPHPMEEFSGGMYQHDFDGRRLFQHRIWSKWSLMEPLNAHIPGFQDEEHCLADLERL